MSGVREVVPRRTRSGTWLNHSPRPPEATLHRRRGHAGPLVASAGVSVLHTYELGDPHGEPLLAVHGITAHGLRFRRLAEEAWPERRTIAVDLRGHGHSTYAGPWSLPQHVADLRDTLAAADVGAVDVVGHSFGATIGLALLAAAPALVRRLVLLDPAVLVPGEVAAARATEVIEAPGWATVEEATVARNAGLGDDIHPAVVEDVGQHLVRGDDGRYRFRFHKAAVVTAWGEVCLPLPSLEEVRPALLVAASRGGFVGDDVVDALRRLFGTALTVVTVDAGHMLYWERYDETAAAITAFFRATS
jgi:lipase